MRQGRAAMAGQSLPDVARSCPNLRACRSGSGIRRDLVAPKKILPLKSFGRLLSNLISPEPMNAGEGKQMRVLYGLSTIFGHLWAAIEHFLASDKFLGTDFFFPILLFAFNFQVKIGSHLFHVRGGRNVSNFDEKFTTLKILVLHAGWLENHELTMDSLLYPMDPKFLSNQGYAKKLNKKDGWEVDDAFCSP
ncbi:60S ribosomal protein L29-2-like protein [Corchorus capsularis]|uniref:60S ribosomal protein L29-2-like protein n=1 Tax=Corchorus capsularis TaxID=210143 RepID=A0A1R3FUY1_COCAP|nr:60S ribosomal protein L29-2-like protein [Corchorus capsularis]